MIEQSGNLFWSYRSVRFKGETEKVADLFGRLRVIVRKLGLHARFNIKKFSTFGGEKFPGVQAIGVFVV